jgi:SAM-dependent methyltransferase
MPPPDLTRAPRTDPTSIYRARDGLYADDLLIVALAHLDLFSWLAGRGPDGASEAEIAAAFELAPRLTDVMVTLFKAQGLLVESAGRLRLTPVAAEHLVASSPWFLGPYFASLKDRAGAVDLLEVMRTGRPVFWGGRQEAKPDWHAAMEDDAYAERFTAAMDCRGVLLGQAAAAAVDLSNASRLLDIAGGSGIYACAFVARHPHLHASVLEKPPVDAVASRLIAARGFSDRVSVVTADMMAGPLPAGFDAHLWSNVLHDWDIPDVRRLIAASHHALRPGGFFLMHDAFLNDAKDGPLHVAEYSVTLAHATQGRCYGTAEIRGWLEEAGFAHVAYAETAAARGLVIARKSVNEKGRG